MNRKRKPFKAIFFNELRETCYYPLAVVGVLFVGGAIFTPWQHELAGRRDNLFDATSGVAAQYAGYWGRYALFSVSILAALLPAGMFARERKSKEIACLQRFPVSLQTVFLAKFSAAFALTALVAVGFVLSGFCFDLSYGEPPFGALTEFTRRFDPREFALLKAFALCPLELLIWSAFWAARIRRESIVVAASLLSTFAVWGLVGYVASSIAEAPRGSALLETLRQSYTTDYFKNVAVGGVASVESTFYTASRFGALLLPIFGIACAFRRNGAKTMLGNEPNRFGFFGFLGFRLKRFLTKRRRPVALGASDVSDVSGASSVSATVPVDPNASPKRRERSTSVFKRLPDLFDAVAVAPRRFRPLLALTLETIKSASLFGRFRGSVAIDLAILNFFFLFMLTVKVRNTAFLAWFVFVVLFGTGAFAGLRRDRSILTTRLPVSPSVFYASQLLAYAALYVVACLPTSCLQLLFPEALDELRRLIWEKAARPGASPIGPCCFAAYHWFVVFCASAVARTRLGAAILSVLFYVALLYLKVELYGLADGTPPEAFYTVVCAPTLAFGVVSYLAAPLRFKRGGN